MTHDPTTLPEDLPVPRDDGAADHLTGTAVPPVALPATDGTEIRLDRVPEGSDRLVVYCYPMTGLPGVATPDGWESVPGARGCTPESCGFRDHAAELRRAGAAVVGMSTQSTGYQAEVVERLRLPYPLVSDADLRFTDALRLPAFSHDLRPENDGGGHRRLLKRLTFVVRDGRVERVFYPVFPPDTHAAAVLAWVTGRG